MFWQQMRDSEDSSQNACLIYKLSLVALNLKHLTQQAILHATLLWEPKN